MHTLFKTGAAVLIALAASAPGASASPKVYDVFLSGPGEFPPNASPGTGFATVTIDPIANTLAIDLSFSGLLGNTTASHIHCCTPIALGGSAGVATTTPTFPGFPLGVTSGTYDMTFDLTLASSYNPAFITANGGTTASAEAFLLAGIANDDAYLNIHSSVVPGGEIRGFLVPAGVPEPMTVSLFGMGLVGCAFARRKRNQNKAL